MCAIEISVRPVTVSGVKKYIGQVTFQDAVYSVAKDCASEFVAMKRARMVANHMAKAMEVVGMEYVLHFAGVDIS